MYDVFVSYHRSDGSAMAQLIEEKLASAGHSVLLDYHSIRSGDYNAQWRDEVAGCTDFLLVLSPEALPSCGRPGIGSHA